MNKRDYDLSLLLGLIILITNFVVITPILFLQYQSSSKIFQQNLIKDFEEEFNLTRFFIDAEFTQLTNQTKVYTEDDFLKRSLENKDYSSAKKAVENIYNNTSTNDFLALTYNEDQNYFDASINLLENNDLLKKYLKEMKVNTTQLVELNGLIAYFTSRPITSNKTGRILGNIHTGILLNENIELISSISEKINYKEIVITHNKKIVVGTKKWSKNIIEEVNARPHNQLISYLNKVFYKSKLDIDGVNLEFYYVSNKNILQNLRSSFLKTFIFTIVITIVLSISAVFIASKAILPSLNRLLQYLESSIKDDNLKIYHKSTIREFNLISESFSTVFNNFQRKKGQISKLIDSSHLPTIIWDNNERVTQFNDSAKELLGIKEINDHISEDTLLKSCYRFSQFIEMIENGSEIVNEELIFKSFDEWKYTSWTINYDKDDDVYFAQCIDNTEKVITMKQIESERSKTIHNQKLAALGEVAGSIAHEVNNPMGVISLSLSLIEKEIKGLTKDNPKKKELIFNYLKNIDQSVTRTSSIVSHFLDFSRDSKKDNQELRSVNNTVKKSLIFIEEKIKRKKISLSIDIDAELKFFVKETQFSQVLINLINNAIDALSDVDDKMIIISASEENGMCNINLKDTGPGVSNKIKESIFNPFFTTKEKGKGTGLGLSISKTIIEEMGGELELRQSVVGAHFIISIPSKKETSS